MQENRGEESLTTGRPPTRIILAGGEGVGKLLQEKVKNPDLARAAQQVESHPPSEWAWLNKGTSQALLRDLPRTYPVSVAELVHLTGMEMRIENDRLALRARADAKPLIYAEPLHTDDGTLRSDAGAVLSRDALGEPADVEQWLGLNLQHELDTGNLEVSRHGFIQLQFWANREVTSILRTYIEDGHRVFRVGGHTPFYNRVRLLEMIDELRQGVAPADLRIGPRRPRSTLVSGILQLYPGALLCFPMTARNQPLALVYMTTLASQIVVLPPKGKVFKRPMQMVTWPVGTVGQLLAGPGKGIYRDSSKPWQGEGGLEIFQSCVQAANGLLKWILDPGRWRDANGHFQAIELWLAWTSLLQGMAALTALGETWNGSSSLWDAFRALGILQGVWAGSAEGSVKLSDMLQPGRLRTCAEGNISDPRLRDWSIAVIRNWEEKLSEGFPGKTANDAVVLAADVRNVLHGVGNLGQDRARRLRTLRAIADSDARLQLIADIAALWWTAAMFAPAKAYRAGRPPWAS